MIVISCRLLHGALSASIIVVLSLRPLVFGHDIITSAPDAMTTACQLHQYNYYIDVDSYRLVNFPLHVLCLQMFVIFCSSFSPFSSLLPSLSLLSWTARKGVRRLRLFLRANGSPCSFMHYRSKFGKHMDARCFGGTRNVGDQPSMYDRRLEKSCGSAVGAWIERLHNFCGRQASSLQCVHESTDSTFVWCVKNVHYERRLGPIKQHIVEPVTNPFQ